MATLLRARATCLGAFAAPRAPVAAPFTASFTHTSARPPQNARPRGAAPLPPRLPAPAARTASTCAAADATVPAHVLTWNRFFALRRRRRWLGLGCSVFTAVAAVGAAAPLLSQADLDRWGPPLAGLDPRVVLGLSTFAVAAAGWLCGPGAGNLIFRLWAGRRGWTTGIAEKERSFYARVKRYRADASGSSPQNPIPDYYGEKIASVPDYRRWLKDQRAFNLKKNKNML